MKTSASLLSSDLNANPHPLHIVRGESEEQREIQQDLRNLIAERAYRLYQQAGGVHGRHEEHWLQAETQILQRIPQIRASGPWVIVNLQVPNVPAEGFKLLITEEQALVEVEEPAAAHQPAAGPVDKRCSFYLALWPAPVAPGTASAYVKNGTLTLEVKLDPHPPQTK